MSAWRFYLTCRMNGMDDLTKERAEELRDLWFRAFPEMEEHMRPLTCQGPDADHIYQSRTLTGRWRRRCTFCSALNAVFQGLAADGLKMALWLLFRAGFKMVNEIHDEIIFELPADGAPELVAEAEALMLAGMAQVVPDVKLGVESAIMHRWSKGAKRKEDDQGSIVAWDDDEEDGPADACVDLAADEEDNNNDDEETLCDKPKVRSEAEGCEPTFW